MFFILFLCYVTVGLAALQFNSPSVTLLNIILTYFMFNFYLQNPPHTPSTPSPTDSISGGGWHVFGDPFPNTRQATKVARETSVFFCFCFCFFCFFLFFCFFFYKGKTAFFEKRRSAVRNTPVDRGTITANPGLNFNSSFFFFYSKAFSQIIFSIIFRHPIIR